MSVPLLAVEGLAKSFVASRSILGTATSTVKAVDDVSFTLDKGQTLALVGESGCGKSTIGRLVLRLIDPTRGSVRFEGVDIGSLKGRGLRAFRSRAQIVFQDPYASLNPRLTIGETLAEPLLLHTQLAGRARDERIGELLSLVGLRPEHARRYPHEFSGGQRQRISIARALAPEPKLIVCDEPVSALDVSIRAQILNLLADLRRRLGLAYIFISHDLAVVKHIADRVGVMYLGRMVETAPTEALFATPRHPYTRALLAAIPLPAAGDRPARRRLGGEPPSPIDPPSGCHLHPRCPHQLPPCAASRPDLVASAQGHGVACHRSHEIGDGADALPREMPRPQHVERLLEAFARDRTA